ncbi:50S ribosomal protein L24 [Pelagibaculum spongiae]|uniref:Large ribosomal subunit protein uL24 n=1 Tax=Pelagibaculum spongiae TaxID=2080658 RepID=A0A2V1GQI2_9GAMM|nr:50S ribosomal protein L24 [Pelagibaculum spongiae]PVZ65742.1 50S ribosomal protein L24 [Pelagibaculum spongiae]
MRKLQKGDEVIVINGKDNGKRGTIKKVGEDRVLVEGINLVKKHVKPNPNAGVAGGIVEKEAALHISNVAIFNAATGKADRVGIKIEDDKKVRVFKSNGEPVGA